jgi:hypothetical protein
MRFLIRLENQRSYTPVDRRLLTLTMFDCVKSMGGNIGNLRVSSYAIEFDLLTNSKTDMEQCLKEIEKQFGKAITVRELDMPVPGSIPFEAVRSGVALFNEERYWERHESLELAWRSVTGSDRAIIQGIILLAAALVHLQKNEIGIALSIMIRANDNLPDHGILFGIDLTELKQRVKKCMAEGMPIFFKIPSIDV